MSNPDRETRLEQLFTEHSPRVHAYAHRHVGPDQAPDVVSDTFLVAWRRIEEVPAEALPWLLVVARNTISNGRRSTLRRQRVTDQLTHLEGSTTATPGADEVAIERRTTLAALSALTPRAREALLLVAWDGLTLDQAAEVAGCSRRALEVRLLRARSRLRHLLDEPEDTPAPTSPAPTSPALTSSAPIHALTQETRP